MKKIRNSRINKENSENKNRKSVHKLSASKKTIKEEEKLN